MLIETLSLRPEDEAITLTAYVSDNPPEMALPPRPAILILPGGGYSHLSNREGEPIVKKFMAEGFNAFLLRYGIGEAARFPRPLVEVSRAIVHIRENAERYHIDPQRLFVIGFSAGGHLCASIATMWHEDFAKASPDMPEGMNRPTGVILSYPVISGGEYGHKGSFKRILGTDTPTEEQLKLYSLEYRVDERTVPAYIWHTAADKSVPVENSLMFAMQMSKVKIPFELHIFPRGGHGLSLATPETNKGAPCGCPEVAQWIGEAIDWISRI